MEPVAAPRSPGRIAAAAMPVAVLAGVMWVGEIVDTILGGDLDRFGIRPRRVDGLDGIVLSPFLHSGFAHLIANTIPFMVMGIAISLSGTRRFLQASAIIAGVSGAGVWLFSPGNSITIGASGLVFGYLTYLVSRGIFARQVGYLLMGIVTFFVYGGVLWGLVPRPGISWQGHLFGAIGGVVAAYVLHANRSPTPKRDDPDEPLVLGWS